PIQQVAFSSDGATLHTVDDRALRKSWRILAPGKGKSDSIFQFYGAFLAESAAVSPGGSFVDPRTWSFFSSAVSSKNASTIARVSGRSRDGRWIAGMGGVGLRSE